MNKLVALFKLTRIEHSIMLVLAVLSAELIANGVLPIPLLLLSIVPAILISMGAFAINDYFDVNVDRLNKRKRPIVIGAISKKEAFSISIICFAFGVLVSLFINIYVFLIAAIFAILAYLYSYKLKEILIIGNVYVAFTMVIPFIYGSYVVASSPSITIIIISLMIFLSGFAREIHGMIRDHRGDIKARNVHNVISAVGIKKSAQFAFTLYMEAIALSIYLFFFQSPFAFNIIYAVMITVVDLMLLYVALIYLKDNLNRRSFDLTRNISLGAMALALVTLILCALVYIPI